MEARAKLDIFKARQEMSEAERHYSEQLNEFAQELEVLKVAGTKVCVKGFPHKSTVKIVNPNDGTHHFVSVACAPIIPVEGEPEQPWERTGLVVGYKKTFNNLFVDIGGKPDSSYVTFKVSRMSAFDVVDGE